MMEPTKLDIPTSSSWFSPGVLDKPTEPPTTTARGWLLVISGSLLALCAIWMAIGVIRG